MYKGNKVLTTITARGGSKGIPRKNIKEIDGKPLIAYTIEQAKNSYWIDRVVVSTDDEEIREVAIRFGAEVPFLRPKEFATDEISRIPALTHAIDQAEDVWGEKFDILVDLLPTSPLRDIEDIEKAVNLLIESKAKSILSVTEANRNPYFNMVEVDSRGFAFLSKRPKKPIMSRQAAPKVYDMNGCIFVMWIKDFLKEKIFFTDKTKLYIMPKERSLDIDDPLDFEIMEFLLKKKTQKDIN